MLLLLKVHLKSGNIALLGQLLQRVLVMWSHRKAWRNTQSEIHSCSTCQNA